MTHLKFVLQQYFVYDASAICILSVPGTLRKHEIKKKINQQKNEMIDEFT